MSFLLLPLLALACKPSAETADTAFDPSDWPLGAVVATEGQGILAELETSQGTLHVLRLRGDHHEMGRQMGVLVGENFEPLWSTFLTAFSEDMGMDPEAMESTFGYLVDGAWNHMAPYVPPAQLDVIDGLNEALGVSGDDACMACRVVAISNISDINSDEIMDAIPTISTGYSAALDTYYATGPDSVAPMPRPPADVKMPFSTCSFFSAWGSRTQDGHLIAHRNLDWSSDTGIADYKTVTIYVPTDGGHPYATFGYMGMVGALAGLSSAGVAVSEVGSTGVLERLTGEPWVLRNNEILENATDLDEALAFHASTVSDGFTRPPTIGYNLMTAWGDPDGSGAGAEASVVETNGAMSTFVRGGSAGSVEIHTFNQDGTPGEVWSLGQDPVNAEAEAVEIDAWGQPRTFAWDGTAFVTDESGNYVEDPAGQPMPLGLPLENALFRGDEDMTHYNRRFQIAANGPQEGSGDLMARSGSYTGRYRPMHEMLSAWETGTSYVNGEGTTVIADNGGQPVPVGLAEGEVLAREAAMDGNILSVVYDATALQVRLSYETGTGDTWVPASDQPEYIEIDLGPAFTYE